jgi:hypothetical protein
MKTTRLATLCAALGLASFLNFSAQAQVTVDGTRDANYGSALAVQTCGTGFGAGAGGSSLANAYAINDGTNLYLFIAGNLETNWNKLAIFLDTRSGGQNKLSNTGGADYGFLAKMNDLEFDSGFEADSLINVRWGGTALYADLDTFGTSGAAPTPVTTAIAGGSVSGSGNAKTATVSLSGAALVIDNSATGGPTATNVGGSSGVTTGVEIKIPLAALGSPTGAIKVCALISNGAGDDLSNQVLAGLPLGTENLASVKTAWNMKNYSGNQFFTVSAPAIVDTDGDGIADATDPDDDGDGLDDTVETNTGVFVSASNTGSNPLIADTDGDGVNDGAEVTAGTNPNKPNFATMAAPGTYAFSGAWSPDGTNNTAMTKVGEFGWSLQRYFGTLGNFVSKFAANGTWDKQWGYSGTPGKALAGGGDITNSVTQTGIHLYTFNNDTLDFTFARVTFPDYASYATAYGLTGIQTADDDGDGITNGDEFTANTDPTRFNDAEAPVLSLASGVAKMVWVALGAPSPTFANSDISATDNVPGSLEFDIQPADGVDTTTAGFKPVTYTVQDAAGNFSTITRAVAVGDVKADFFNLQWPAAATINTSSSADVYAQIYIPNVTQGAGAAPAIQAWLGVNATDVDPSTWPSSAWSSATYFGESGNNDEYRGTISGSTLPVGTQYYAVRWQIGSGAYAYSGITAGGDGGEWGTTYTDTATPPVTSTRGNGVLTVQGTRQITFAVDMGVQIFKGAFDPATNGVEVRGDFNGFAGGASTLAREGSTTIYSGAFTVGGNENATQGYKFVGTGTNALSWETMADNRSLTLGAAGSSTNLPTAFFNNLSESRKITFRVDMSVQAAKGNFNTNTGVVQIAGSFNGWSTTATPLTAQGNGVYAVEVTVDGPVSGIAYKFLKGTAEGDYEVLSADRTITAVLPNLDSSTLDVVLFGNDDGVAPTDIALSASSIAENNAVNAVVGTLSSTDATAGDTHTYSLVAGAGDTDNASFNISGASLRAGVAFDFETKSSYSVRVRSTDATGNSFEKAFTVTVSDVNETPAGSTFAAWSGGAELNSANVGKYAIGGASSLSATDGVKPTSTVTGGNLVLTAIVRTDDTKLTVVGQAVTSLADYAPGGTVVSVTGVDTVDQSGVPAGHKKQTFTVAQDGARKFLRLKATLAP